MPLCLFARVGCIGQSSFALCTNRTLVYCCPNGYAFSVILHGPEWLSFLRIFSLSCFGFVWLVSIKKLENQKMVSLWGEVREDSSLDLRVCTSFDPDLFVLNLVPLSWLSADVG